MKHRLFTGKIGFLPLFVLLFLFIQGINNPVNATHYQVENGAAKLLTRIPFTLLSGGIIIIKVQLDDFPDTLNFILDTGSSGISLNSNIVDYFHLKVTPTERMLRGIGSLRKMSYVTNRTLHLPKLTIENLDFHINNYELLSSVYGIRIDGIVGFSLFSRYIVKVNYDRNLVEILSTGTLKYPKKGLLIKPSIVYIPVVNADVVDDTVCSSRFYFDTGAGLCILLNEDFVRDSSILQEGKKIMITQAEGLSGKTSMKLSTLRYFQIGHYKFKKVPVHIFKDEYNVTSYPYLGGIIGNDLLRRFNLIINYQQQEMHLKPNSHFKEPFDYSYTGLGIYMIDGQIMIEDVLKDSPGEKAGLQPGDLIIAIDNNMSGNIQTYKNLLQVTGSKLKMVILRNGKPIETILRVKSFL